MFGPSDSLDNILPCHLSCAGLGEDPNDFHIPRGYPRPLPPPSKDPGCWHWSQNGLSLSLGSLRSRPESRHFHGPQLLSVPERL